MGKDAIMNQSLQNSPDLSTEEINSTPLMQVFHAAKVGDYQRMIDYFVDGGDPNLTIPERFWNEIEDKDLLGERTLLMVLAKFPPHHSKMPYYLGVLRIMKFADADVNKRSKSGATPAMFMTHNNNLIALDFFAEWKEVDWSARTESGMSAYDFAAEKFHHDILLRLGARVVQAVTLDTAFAIFKEKQERMKPADFPSCAHAANKTLEVLELEQKFTS